MAASPHWPCWQTGSVSAGGTKEDTEAAGEKPPLSLHSKPIPLHPNFLSLAPAAGPADTVELPGFDPKTFLLPDTGRVQMQRRRRLQRNRVTFRTETD